ncbi:MAG: LL-diaminopimelate aminotransferase [Candidatus Dadabacteria bacterium]|jgi:LL-diaminopimelate aminotransferase|nr:LL-diaminopimelate aminotransferase [Candidatus Dadabacteria bacterium]MCZ6684519.1 LL-diaminopimelate aminotransferase [Candidatus Dadabacteria bacterium]
MDVKWASRIAGLPPYLFAEIDAKKNELIKKGVEVIDLGVGDPDIPTPDFIIEALKVGAEDPENHRYPSYQGMRSFRVAVADWYKERFNVDLDPDTEVIALIGSKEGIAHAPLAFIDPGDVGLFADPGYPVYPTSISFAGGEPYAVPILKENDFLPDLNAIPEDIRKRAQLIFLNYPNNPTTAIAEEGFFKDVVDFASKNNILICHDAAYTEIAYDGYSPLSFLQADGAKDVGIEFHSLSKTFNMTGWRIAFAVGNKKAIAGIGKIKTNIDSGAFQAVQYAGIVALQNYKSGLQDRIQIFQERRDIFCKGLDEAGLKYHFPKATFYVWFEVPEGLTSKEFSSKLLSESGIVVTPGNGFGEYGEGYARVSTTFSTERIIQAVERLKETKF